MKDPTLVRVDYRLLHGMVAATWIKSFSINKVYVLDDKVKNDPFLQDVFNLAKPAGLDMEYLTLKEGADKWKEGGFEEKEKEHILILIRNIYSVDELMKAGAVFNKITIGNMETDRKKKAIKRTFFMDENDARLIDNLVAGGTEVVFQQVPSDAVTAWQSLRNKYFKNL